MAKRVSKSDMRQTEIQRMILAMAGSRTAYEIFIDWIECSALAIANSLRFEHDEIWTRRENLYLSIMEKYTEEERAKFPVMFQWLVEELENDPRDVLGEVFMRSGMGSDAGGQFFTPFNISKMMAAINTEHVTESKDYSLSEPSCGSGGGIIAMALAFRDKGIDFQRYLKVVAQDLDWRCVYMCYVQLSLLGIDAICVQGDTLMDPYRKGYPAERTLRTPKNMGVIV